MKAFHNFSNMQNFTKSINNNMNCMKCCYLLLLFFAFSYVLLFLHFVLLERFCVLHFQIFAFCWVCLSTFDFQSIFAKLSPSPSFSQAELVLFSASPTGRQSILTSTFQAYYSLDLKKSCQSHWLDPRNILRP